MKDELSLPAASPTNTRSGVGEEVGKKQSFSPLSPLRGSETERAFSPQPSGSAAESGRVRGIIYLVSAAVCLGVIFVIYLLPARSQGADPTPLATLNAALNAAASACLLAGYYFVRRRKLVAHRRAMLTAFALSATFLVTYLMHHAQVGSVPFRGVGLLRTLYFAILIPHIVLAALVVPLALFTIYRGLTGRIPQHRKIARYTLPIWLYVSTSGVIVYLMLYHLPV